jgi:glucose-6-phosphate isomerase
LRGTIRVELAAAWHEAEVAAARPDARQVRARFADPGRVASFVRSACGIRLDATRTSLDAPSLAALRAVARAADARGFLARMLAGEAVNHTERRAAWHSALRAEAPPPEAARTLAAMRAFCTEIHAGGRFTDVLNIGIGGSDLGPMMAEKALRHDGQPMRAHYLANVDAHAWERLRVALDPDRTLVLVASKTFTTAETMANARLARDWLGPRAASQMAALSTNLAATAEFGITPERVFGFADWVGGRFSLWSAIGLSVALACGWERFEALLAGARAMDAHARDAADEDHLPLWLALIELWHTTLLGHPARAVIPYDDRLGRLPAHLQQLEMESLGKRRDGGEAGGLVFGEPGTNAQHSFFQLLHQGRVVPVEFVLVARPDHAHGASHALLLANGLAQAEALMRGRSEAEALAAMRAAGLDAAEAQRLAPHRAFPGDRPAVTLLLPRLDAFHLGALIALHEHKVALLGALWGINPFDQWGVELGKEMATRLAPALAGAAEAEDAATRAAIAAIRAAR